MSHSSGAPLHEFVSHIAGKNAIVRVFPTHIEWETKGNARVGLAMVTMGVSTAFKSGRRAGAGTEMMPIKAVTSVTTKRGMLNSRLVIIASGNTIEANIAHHEAEAVKATLLRLINESSGAASAAAAPVPAGSAADELTKLAALHQQGILSDEEFAAAKTRLLR